MLFEYEDQKLKKVHILCTNKSSTPQSQCKQRRHFVKKSLKLKKVCIKNVKFAKFLSNTSIS